MEITALTLVADIAAHHPRSIDVFERHGIDFCCGGRRTLGEACRAHGAAVEAVAAEIAAAAAREVPADRVFTDAPLGELLDHSLERFERELHEHVHLENNLLFPRVVSLQARAEGRGGPAGGAR